MNVLQLSPRNVFPPDDGGRISIINVSRHLMALGARLTMVCYDENAPFVIRKNVEGHEFDLYSILHSTANTLPRILQSLFDSEALYLRKHMSSDAEHIISEIIQAHKIQIIHIDHTAMAPLGLKLALKFNLPVGLRLHNIEWKIWQRYADSLPSLSPKRWYVQSQAAKLRRHEAECIRDVDVAFPISEIDKKEAQKLCVSARLEVVNAGVNIEEWSDDGSEPRHEHQIVMAAAWSWIHNVEGALWFIKNVLPKVQARIPNVSLVIPGKNIPESFRQYSHLGVRPIGYVDRIQPTYFQSSVFVVPLFVGSGVRIKIVEAMAAALPVVSTHLGAEGVMADESQGLFRSDSADEQAEIILQLLSNPTKSRQLGKAARDVIDKNYSWNDQISKIYDCYKELVNKRERQSE